MVTAAPPLVVKLPMLQPGPQMEMYNYFAAKPENSTTVLLYGGAFAGGKTYGLNTLAINMALHWPGTQLLIGRKEYEEFNKQGSTLKAFDRMLPDYLNYLPNNKAPITRKIRDPQWPKGVYSSIDFRGVSDYEKFGSSEYQGIFLDEGAELAEEVPRYLLGRIRHIENADFAPAPKFLLFIASNPWPGYFQSWAMEDGFFQKGYVKTEMSPDVKFIRSVPSDNKFLPPGYVENLIASYPPSWQARFLRGDFSAVDNAWLEEFDWPVHVRPLMPNHDNFVQEGAIGIDFGGGHPTVITVIQRDVADRIVVRETWAQRTNDPDIIMNQAKRLADRYGITRGRVSPEQPEMAAIMSGSAHRGVMHVRYSPAANYSGSYEFRAGKIRSYVSQIDNFLDDHDQFKKEPGRHGFYIDEEGGEGNLLMAQELQMWHGKIVNGKKVPYRERDDYACALGYALEELDAMPAGTPREFYTQNRSIKMVEPPRTLLLGKGI